MSWLIQSADWVFHGASVWFLKLNYIQKELMCKHLECSDFQLVWGLREINHLQREGETGEGVEADQRGRDTDSSKTEASADRR